MTTGGQYFRATDVNALDAVYKEIDGLEKSTAKVKEYYHADERFLDALLPALVLYLLQWGFGQTLLRRLP